MPDNSECVRVYHAKNKCVFNTNKYSKKTKKNKTKQTKYKQKTHCDMRRGDVYLVNKRGGQSALQSFWKFIQKLTRSHVGCGLLKLKNNVKEEDMSRMYECVRACVHECTYACACESVCVRVRVRASVFVYGWSAC